MDSTAYVLLFAIVALLVVIMIVAFNPAYNPVYNPVSNMIYPDRHRWPQPHPVMPHYGPYWSHGGQANSGLLY